MTEEPNAGIEGREMQKDQGGEVRKTESPGVSISALIYPPVAIRACSLAFHEAHGVELLQLLLISHFWSLHL